MNVGGINGIEVDVVVHKEAVVLTMIMHVDGRIARVYMSPGETRDLAAQLMAAADDCQQTEEKSR